MSHIETSSPIGIDSSPSYDFLATFLMKCRFLHARLLESQTNTDNYHAI